MHTLSEKTAARILAGFDYLGFAPNHGPAPTNRMLTVDELRETPPAMLDNFSLFMQSPECTHHRKAKKRSVSSLAVALSEEVEIHG